MGRAIEQPIDIQLSDVIKVIADRVIAKSDTKCELEDIVNIISNNSDVFQGLIEYYANRSELQQYSSQNFEFYRSLAYQPRTEQRIDLQETSRTHTQPRSRNQNPRLQRRNAAILSPTMMHQFWQSYQRNNRGDDFNPNCDDDEMSISESESVPALSSGSDR